MENRDYFLSLLEKFRDNSCSPDEVKHLLGYFRKDSHEQDQLMELVLAYLQETPNAELLENKNLNSIMDNAFLNIRQEIAQSHSKSNAWRTEGFN